MKKLKRILAGIITILILMSTIIEIIPVYAVNSEENIEIKSNEEVEYSEVYKEYLKLSDEEKEALGVIPKKYNVPLDNIYENTVEVTENANIFNLFGLLTETTIESSDSEIMPNSFDLRNEINIPVRDQGNEGLCWNFASLKSLETYLSIKGYGEFDFSEWHVSLMETKEFGVEDREDTSKGGNFSYFEDYIERNLGPVYENEVPYEQEYTIDDYDYLLNLEQKAGVTGIVNFSTIDKSKSHTDEELELFRDKVKKHIQENGSIYAVIYSNDIKEVGNNYTLYTSSMKKIFNHGISIIGWDDSFSKNNFKDSSGNTPSKDGAYIAMNSWGEDWGNKGIFYISYEDVWVEYDMNGIETASAPKDFTKIQIKDENLYNALIEELGDYVASSDKQNKVIELNELVIKKITELDLSDKNIRDITGIEYFTQLTKLDLSNNNIEDASKIESLTKISELYLGYNNIKDINFVKGLENLYLIDLSGNVNLTEIEKLSNVSELYLNDCNLDDYIIDKIATFEHLRILELRNNNIINPKNLGSIYSLDLSGNIGLDLKNLPEIKGILKLENCNIDSLVDVINCFNGYSYELSIENNPINDSQLEYILSKNITKLNIKNTNITNISDLTNIEKLTIGGSTELTGIEKLTNLKSLLISEYELKNISKILSLTNLDVLSIIDCGLEDITGISNLSKITKLDLSNNNLSNIEELAYLSKLYNLNINNNKITDLSCLKDIKKLYEICAKNNNIIDISILSDFYKDDMNIELDNNEIEYTNREALRRIDSAKNQSKEINTEVIINADNRFYMPELFYVIYENRYNIKGNMIWENCTLDLENQMIIIHPNSYGANTATLKITEGKFAGTVYEINYNTVDELDVKGIKIVGDTEYVEGDSVDISKMQIYYEYGNGIIEIEDYSEVIIENAENLSPTQERIKIKYRTYETEYNIKVYDKDEAVSFVFKDYNMYKISYNKIVVENEGAILYENKENLKLIAKKETIEAITKIYINDSKVTDITGISKFYNATSVMIDNTKITDISCLEKMLNLSEVYIYDGVKIDNIGKLLENPSIERVQMYCKFEEKDLQKSGEKIILPQYIQVTKNIEGNKISAETFYYNESGEMRKNTTIEEDDGKLVVELDKKISTSRTAKDRMVRINSTDKDGIYKLNCEIYYSVIEQPEATLTGIEITKNPAKTIYREGENFDNTGMVVKKVYSDGTKEKIENYKISKTLNLTTEDIKIIVSYEEEGESYTADLDIVVNEKISVTGIEISIDPTKTIYTEEEIFDNTGMVVKKVYSDGTKEIITKYKINPNGKLEITDKKVIIIYEENGKTYTADVAITVTEREIVPEILKGDLDGNGKITITDLSVMNQYIVRRITFNENQILIADMDSNGKVTITDLSMLNKVLVSR